MRVARPLNTLLSALLITLASDFATVPAMGAPLAPLTVGTEGAARPFRYFTDPSVGHPSHLAGFEVDLVHEIARRLGRTTHWVMDSAPTLLSGLRSQRYALVAASLAVTPARLREAEWTIAHYCSSEVIVSRPDGPTTRAGLKGRSVGLAAGTVSLGDARKAFPGSEIRTYSNDADAFLALQLGKVTAWMADRRVVRDLLRRSGGHYSIGESLFPGTRAMAVRRGDRALRKAIDRTLREMFRDGSYAKLSLRSFGEDVRCKEVRVSY